MDIPNIGPYASVVGQAQTPKRMLYRRGYGTIVSTILENNKINTSATLYNRLQPLSGQFGNHLPTNALPDYSALNPQTNIAWDNSQPIPATTYQNQEVKKLNIGINSAEPGN
jgi:hypothetical protein